MRRICMIAAALQVGCGNPQTDNLSQVGAEGPSPADALNMGQANQQPADPANTIKNPELVSVSACLIQGSERLQVASLRAIGTEPFWALRIEGRCVTYSTPDDQQGTRVWTRYSQGPDGDAAWIGQLNGSSFEVRTRLEPGCSDGMSDKRYPIAVELVANGEQRRGCAESR